MEQQEEAAPSLRLEILRGPRQGETLEFPPGSAIRIGRVVKGNTLPIKDPGISSKHLSILTESNKWVLRDLDSSNGTVLNDTDVPPHTPFTLHHDSTIKIGEVSSIHVTFLPQQQQQQQTLPPRRNPSRRRGRTQPVPEDLSEPVSHAPSEPIPPEPVPSEPVRPAANRGRGRHRCRVKVKSVEENDAVVESEGVDPPARVTRNSSRVAAVEEKVNEESKKTSRDPSLIEISDSGVGNSSVPVVEEPKKSTRGRRLKNVRGVTGNVECGVQKNVEKESNDVTEKRELEKEGEDGKEKEKENLNGLDLSKMTLGEWFDFLEVYLPKQIMDETEEMIDSMRQKADRLREYIVEMQRQKDMTNVEN